MKRLALSVPATLGLAPVAERAAARPEVEWATDLVARAIIVVLFSMMAIRFGQRLPVDRPYDRAAPARQRSARRRADGHAPVGCHGRSQHTRALTDHALGAGTAAAAAGACRSAPSAIVDRRGLGGRPRRS